MKTKLLVASNVVCAFSPARVWSNTDQTAEFPCTLMLVTGLYVVVVCFALNISSYIISVSQNLHSCFIVTHRSKGNDAQTQERHTVPKCL